MENFSRQFLLSIKKYKNILILIKGSPDPDAIAASYTIKAICEEFNIKSSIIATKNLSLPQNRALVKNLKIPVKFVKTITEVEKFDSYIVTDHQSAFVKEITDKLPCAVHIDHHEPYEEEVKADFVLIMPEAGSTSSIMALILKDLDLQLDRLAMTPVATALLYGIQTDTDKYSHAGKLDYEAMYYLSKYSDNDIINRISNIPLSKKTLDLLKEAIENQIIYKDWLVAGIGFIDASNRDSIAIIADFLLKRENLPTVIIFGAIKNEEKNTLTLDASFRTNQKGLKLNDIIKEITTEGGARKFKGAYQIKLDYFIHCPDKTLLWEIIKSTTLEILEKKRDDIYMIELKGFYKQLKRRAGEFFENF